MNWILVVYALIHPGVAGETPDLGAIGMIDNRPACIEGGLKLLKDFPDQVQKAWCIQEKDWKEGHGGLIKENEVQSQ